MFRVFIRLILVSTQICSFAWGSELDKQREKSCRVVPRDDHACLQSSDTDSTLKSAFELTCKSVYPPEVEKECEQFKNSLVANISSNLDAEEKQKEIAAIEKKIVTCSFDQACAYEESRSSTRSCLHGAKEGVQDIIHSVIGLPGKFAEAVQESQNCFDNKDGVKEELIQLFNADIPEKFQQFRIVDEVRKRAIRDWSCADLKNYLRAKLKIYQAHIGPLVARNEFHPELDPSPVGQALKSLVSGMGKRWTCFTPEAKAELACLSATVIGVPVTSALAMKALIRKFAQLGVSEAQVQSMIAASSNIKQPGPNVVRVVESETKEVVPPAAVETPVAVPPPPPVPTPQPVPVATVSEAASKEVAQAKTVSPSNAVQENPFSRFSAAQKKTWSYFNPNSDAGFKKRLAEFRGNDDLTFDPKMHGREGQIFLSPESPNLALKRFFAPKTERPETGSTNKKKKKTDSSLDVNNPWKGVEFLEEAHEKTEKNPRISRHFSVVKVHEKGEDWILREFDPTSKPLKEMIANPAVEEAKKELLRALAGTKDPILLKIKHKLERTPISENVHWSPTKKKILLIDITLNQPLAPLNQIKLAHFSTSSLELFLA